MQRRRPTRHIAAALRALLCVESVERLGYHITDTLATSARRWFWAQSWRYMRFKRERIILRILQSIPIVFCFQLARYELAYA